MLQHVRRFFPLLLLVTGLTGVANAAERLEALRPGALVLFQGDSITDGGRWREGNDQNHIMGQDYAYLVAAEVGADLPERRLRFVNRGISGNTVVDLERRWQADVIDLKPDVLSILVGINDLLSEKPVPADAYHRTYATLIERTRAALPEVRIVLGEPFLLPVGRYAPITPDLRARLAERQAIVADLAHRYHLPLVRYQAAFDRATVRAPASHWSWDGVHPTYAGHGLMARAWLATVERAR